MECQGHPDESSAAAASDAEEEDDDAMRMRLLKALGCLADEDNEEEGAADKEAVKEVGNADFFEDLQGGITASSSSMIDSTSSASVANPGQDPPSSLPEETISNEPHHDAAVEEAQPSYEDHIPLPTLPGPAPKPTQAEKRSAHGILAKYSTSMRAVEAGHTVIKKRTFSQDVAQKRPRSLLTRQGVRPPAAASSWGWAHQDWTHQDWAHQEWYEHWQYQQWQ